MINHQLTSRTLGKRKSPAPSPHARLGLSLERLEPRLLLTAPGVLSINRTAPLGQYTSGADVSYTVTFNDLVTNVTSADFRATIDGSLSPAPTIGVTGSGSLYTVAVSGIRGSGNLRLDLIDKDSIVDGSAVPLGGAGVGNGSFQGQTYTIDQVFPYVQSILRANPVGPTTTATTVSFTVTFSEPVIGVDPTDFTLALTGSVGSTLTQVAPVSDSVYTVTISGITGGGMLGLNLTDDGSIRDLNGNCLVPQNPSSSFQSQSTSAAGSSPVSMAVADVNGDGKYDLVSVNAVGNTASVLLGNGNGTFQTQTTYATGTNPRSVAVADVNGDGKPDLIVANAGNNTVGVLLGNGNGTFQSQTTYATGSGPYSLAVTDLNGDGKPDLIVANTNGNTVGVLLGNGNGTFQSQTTYATGSGPLFVAVADFNSDGKPDLVAANVYGNTVSVLLGNGNGTFQSQTTYATGLGPHSVAVADLNGDGKPDLIVANYSSNTLGVLLGNGNGTFQSQTAYTTGSGPISVAVADLNGDGKPDPVVANYSSKTLGVLLGNGNGTLQSQLAFTTGSGPISVAVADLNGDGKPDPVVVNFGNNNVGVLLGNLNGNFSEEAYTITMLSTVVDRKLFYKGSSRYDTTGAAWAPLPNAHDNAIASDKAAYLPGSGAATFANVSSYSLGINGIMVDLAGTHGAITASDFTFKVGNDNSPGAWITAPAPTTVMTRPGAGVSGADRVELIWADNAIQKQWLEILVKGNDTQGGNNTNTGLAASDVFFFGNAQGDSSVDDVSAFVTNANDEIAARGNPKSLLNNIPITNLYDFNRDGKVDANDWIISRSNSNSNLNAPKFISIDIAGPFALSATFTAGTTTTDPPLALVLTSSTTTNISGSNVNEPIPFATPPHLNVDLKNGKLVDAFNPLAHTTTPRDLAILREADRINDATGLDDELLDALFVDLELA